MTPRQRLLLAGCAAPAGAFFLAFWLLPALRLLALQASQKAYGRVSTLSLFDAL